MKKKQILLSFLFFFVSANLFAAPSSRIPEKDADPLGMKNESFSTYQPKVERQFEADIKKQIQLLQSANQYSKKAFRSEKFSTLKLNAKKAMRLSSKIIPTTELPEDDSKVESATENPSNSVEGRITATAQSVYVYNKLALKSKSWKEAKAYVKQAMESSEELLYPQNKTTLEDGDLVDYLKAIL